jgi:hypothetical protein
MSEDRRDEELRRELERLGEPAADAEEIAAAERLASRMEGALHVVGPADEGDMSTLAQTLRYGGGDAGAGDAATDRVLAAIFADADPAADESPADELERRRVEILAAGVDRMIGGMQPLALDAPADVRELLHLAAMIRASAHAAALSPGRLETLVDQAYGAQAPAAATSPRRGGALWRLALVAVLSVVVLGAALVMGGYLGPRPAPLAQQHLPTHLTSRSTRDILPGAFPRTQTTAERIDLIYHDRLRSFRELHLGGQLQPPRAKR